MAAQLQSLALVDCNNFYCSCERLFRPDLNGKPLVVLSNNDGCVVSRSAEAKALGIKMAEPWFKISDLAKRHGVLAFSSNYALYADMSDRVMAILSDYSPIQEVYSIDESFLDLSGFTDIRTRSFAIRRTVLQQTGITVCVGVGPSKTLAKLSNHIAKVHPRSKGVFNYNELTAAQQASMLGNLPASDVWGIGRQLSKGLADMGIKTVLQLRDADPASLRSRFGVVMEKTIRELRGEDCMQIEEMAPPRKQIVSSRSFGNTVNDVHDLADALTHFVSNATVKLRSQKSNAGLVQVFIMTDRFRQEQPQYNPTVSIALPVASADAMVIANWAVKGLHRIFKTGYEYKKAGVILGDINPAHILQTDLFAAESDPARLALMETMDSLNARYGRGTLKLSGDGARRSWKMRADNRSPCYTTAFDQIATCR